MYYELNTYNCIETFDIKAFYFLLILIAPVINQINKLEQKNQYQTIINY